MDPFFKPNKGVVSLRPRSLALLFMTGQQLMQRQPGFPVYAANQVNLRFAQEFP